MGWITKRRMESGRGVGGRRRGRIPKDSAPLRKIVGLLRASTGMFDTARVLLECGHEAKSNGMHRARCLECLKKDGDIAQMGERDAGSVEVGGSIPPVSTK